MDNDRNWMYRRLENGFLTAEYCVGVESFVTFALSHPECLLNENICCLCNRKKCQNKIYLDEDTVKVHLGRYGFVPDYYNWFFHGEEYINPSYPNLNMEAPSSFSFLVAPPIAQTTFPDFFDTVEENVNFEENPEDENENFGEQNPAINTVPEVPESPNSYIKSLYECIKSAEKEIWDGNPHGHSMLFVLARLLKMKHEHNMSERNYNAMCQLMSELCPSDNYVPESFYATKKIIKDLGLPVEKIDACKNNCMIYWGVDDVLTECNLCEHLRYKRSRSRSQNPEKKGIPYKLMYYFPITPRLQRLYASKATTLHMHWYNDHHFDGDTMTHPSDCAAWRYFNALHPS
ncbi:uncharacterized protein LOC142505006 [Primulina tabacum]|uniref:uncharacterized protein LOC142505006 n=1 Tax=Primulina tabacum TaxID=48773 RepID=UPI003F5AC863